MNKTKQAEQLTDSTFHTVIFSFKWQNLSIPVEPFSLCELLCSLGILDI